MFIIIPTLPPFTETTFAQAANDFLIAKIRWSLPWLIVFDLPIGFHSWSLSTLWNTILPILARSLFLIFFLLTYWLFLFSSLCPCFFILFPIIGTSHSSVLNLLFSHYIYFFGDLSQVIASNITNIQPDKSQLSICSPNLSPHSGQPVTQLMYIRDTLNQTFWKKKTILLSSLPEPATSQVSPSPEIASPSFPEAQATYLGTTPDSFVFSCIKSISRSCRLHFQNIFRIWAQFYFLFLPSHFNKSQGLKMVLKPCMIHILQRSPLGVGLLSSLSPTPF